MVEPIRTPRLEIIPSDRLLAEAENLDRGRFFAMLDVDPPPDWPPELNDEETIAFNRDRLAVAPSAVGWWCWYFVLIEKDRIGGAARGAAARQRRALIGCGGFKGPPEDEPDRSVEIGYSILEPYRRRGLASEAVCALCEWAEAHGAALVRAHTLEGSNASVGVLRNADFDGPTASPEPGFLRFERAESANPRSRR